MMPHCKREAQFELFQIAGECASQLSPRLELPPQRPSEIDMPRVCGILGISIWTARRMVQAGLFTGHHAPGSIFWRVDYNSLVDYCNQLRVKYLISSRLSRLPPGRRHRDEDLLPFPLRFTIDANEARSRAYDFARRSVFRLLEEGALTGYRLYEGSGSAWRIDERSLERYLESLRPMVPAAKASLPQSASLTR